MLPNAIDDAIKEIEAVFGRGTVGRVGVANVPKVETVSSGSLALDVALGCGGYPLGRVVEIFGPESSGKSTLMLHALANAQAAGHEVAYVDTEHALDPIYAAAVGADVDRLVLAQPDSAEQALNVVEMLVGSGGFGLVVIDSIAAMPVEAELKGEMGEQTVGALARLMGRAMRKLVPALAEHGTCLICVNQIRYKVGVFFGSPETQPGGMALKFAASQRLDIRRIATEKERGEAFANRCRVKVVKNKVGPPLREAEFEIAYGSGIDRSADLLDTALSLGVLSKSGSWLKYGDEQLAHGRRKALELLGSDSGLFDRLSTDVRERLCF